MLALLLAGVLSLLPAFAAGQQPTRVAVLSITLNDLANQPPAPELPARIRGLASALSVRLGSACGYEMVMVDAPAEGSAEIAPGYLYAHPDVAARLAGAAGADWVVVPRLNRASPWVTDLQAHVVRVRDAVPVSNRIVEVKGIELTPELAARLAERGGAWMADQVSQAIEVASGKAGPSARRCPP